MTEISCRSACIALIVEARPHQLSKVLALASTNWQGHDQSTSSSTIRWLFSSVSGTALVINCNFHFSHLDINYNTQSVFWHSNGGWISNYDSSPASCLSLLFRSTITFHYLCIVVDTHLYRSHLSCGWRWSHNKVNVLTNLCLQFLQMNWGKIRTLFNSEVCATLQSEFYIL